MNIYYNINITHTFNIILNIRFIFHSSIIVDNEKTAEYYVNIICSHCKFRKLNDICQYHFSEFYNVHNLLRNLLNIDFPLLGC